MIPTSGASKYWILLMARFCPHVVLPLGATNNFALSPGHLGCCIRLELLYWQSVTLYRGRLGLLCVTSMTVPSSELLLC